MAIREIFSKSETLSQAAWICSDKLARRSPETNRRGITAWLC
jgi:hypothetical protein